MENHIVILAAGIGKRLKYKIPKQFTLLGDLPILMHTINAFFNSKIHLNIILVLNKVHLNYWDALCKQHNFNIPHTIVEGGLERFFSVKNALECISGDGYVGIHDGVRPFITQKVISKCFSAAYKFGNATPAVPATNTIRIYDQISPSRALNREQVYIVQNPQVFKIDQIKAAYNQKYNSLFTDDATVAENFGIQIKLVPGDRKNIKITYPVDLAIAKGIFEDICQYGNLTLELKH